MTTETTDHKADNGEDHQMTASDFRESLIEVEIANYLLLFALSDETPL